MSKTLILTLTHIHTLSPAKGKQGEGVTYHTQSISCCDECERVDNFRRAGLILKKMRTSGVGEKG
jgi:hypothetical protein